MRALLLLTVSSKKQVQGVSMDEQERLCRDWCQQNNYEVIEPPLRIPGFSRREADIVTLLEDYARKGISAYHDLREHWSKRDFDVLVMYTYSRASRSSTGFAWVIENTVLSGASVYFIDHGRVDRTNMREYIAIGSMLAAGEVDRMVSRRKPAMEKRIAQGFPYSRPPLTHKVIYDSQTGKAIETILDSAKRQLLDDLVTLLVDYRVSWDYIEAELHQRFGHVDPRSGKPYPSNTFYQLLYNPVTHGHGALNWIDHRFKAWVYDCAEPVPEGVTVYRNTHPPAFEGEQAARLFAELHRREEMKGKMRPNTTHPFSGLLVCGECGHAMICRGNDPKRPKRRMGYYCKTPVKKQFRLYLPDCNQRKSINEVAVKAKVHDILERLLSGQSLESLDDSHIGSIAQADQLESEIAGLERKLDERIELQPAFSSTAAKERYQAGIEKLGKEIDEKRAILKRITQQQALIAQTNIQREYALEELRGMGLDTFWEEPSSRINQILRRIFGPVKLVILDAQIVAVRLPRQ